MNPVQNQKRALRVKAGLLALALLAVTGTALAIGVTTLVAEKISTATGRVAPSDLEVTRIDPLIKGKTRVDVVLTLTNGDRSAPHAATVTVQLLDGAGSLLAEEILQTPTIAAGGSWSTTLVFNRPALTADYVETFVVIKQTA